MDETAKLSHICLQQHNDHTVSTDLTARDIFSVVQDVGNKERLRIVQLDDEGREVTSVGEMPYLNSPSAVVCASSIFCLGDWDYRGLVHQFDLVTRTVRTFTRLEEPVRETAFAASGHEVIVSGGQKKNGQDVATCSVFAAATNRWTSLRPLRQARQLHRMCWLSDGRVFAIGGQGLSSVEMLERAWIPAPREEASVEWTNVAPMKTERYMFGCCVVEGRIVVAGGWTVAHKPPSSVESFEPPTPTNIGQWTSLTDLASSVGWCCLVPSAAGLLLIDLDGRMQLGRRKAQVQFPSSSFLREPEIGYICGAICCQSKLPLFLLCCLQFTGGFLLRLDLETPSETDIIQVVSGAGVFAFNCWCLAKIKTGLDCLNLCFFI